MEVVVPSISQMITRLSHGMVAAIFLIRTHTTFSNRLAAAAKTGIRKREYNNCKTQKSGIHNVNCEIVDFLLRNFRFLL